jgi:hypothetical protein
LGRRAGRAALFASSHAMSLLDTERQRSCDLLGDVSIEIGCQ